MDLLVFVGDFGDLWAILGFQAGCLGVDACLVG
jgi:hypothetical protein